VRIFEHTELGRASEFFEGLEGFVALISQDEYHGIERGGEGCLEGVIEHGMPTKWDEQFILSEAVAGAGG
jgi:hypothetical protein